MSESFHYCSHVSSLLLPLFLSLSPSPSDREADKEASEMLTDNAQNLMKAVSEVLYATEAASIRVSPDSKAAKAGLRFVKKGALQGRMP